MSFSDEHGTRGARQPGGVVMKWFNASVVRRVRRAGAKATGSATDHPAKKVMGMNVLVLTTVGRRSGQERATPVGWFDGGDGSWIIVASAAGAAANPAWYHNLAAHPDRLTIETGAETVRVTARELHGDERRDAWATVVAESPRFAEYETRTDRTIPVIRLTRRSDDETA
ncbi:hypothetical protein GCM10025865_24330 [Paraoerskovia sediminicola]|uniref:Deazaflavin-dependent oxidoreductase, nitroreductase family n=1 Tax=Paraoerskovia sediminicola TaxID=1138587 RepID=A0ABN6XEB7_9CELL|nr:nitroreductase/quinone reductase family protein [Paraoerskovia sediminicola]BDZ43134.1 hypothetical protein GCM10025865_24330 [Paraoerskovia sediminicola]